MSILELPNHRKITRTFYVYILFDNERPFYVGKGKGRRVFEHAGEARRGHDCRKCDTIRNVWNDGRDVTIRCVYQTDDEWRALKREREVIAFIGLENLTNRTTGGQGWSRYYTPQEIARKEIEAIAGARRVRDFLAR